MKLFRVLADGFGALRGEFVFDPDRLTLVLDDNERGKSTLLAAVSAALYGLDSDRRSHRVVTPLDRWRPWDGGSYRVELDLGVEGERYRVIRDFESGAIEVRNSQGQEITPEFRTGKEEFSVGRKLLGLDADEFEKCAMVRQGDLTQVIPADEKERRSSTLRARLENAADSHVGDTNASEAMRVLEGALRKYTCAEVESTGTIDTAIQRLELKRATLETEIKTLEHDLSRIHQPLEDLARLGEEEARAREVLTSLEADRRASLAAEVRRKLEDDARHRVEVEQLGAEAEGLSGFALLPDRTETEFGKAVAGYEDAQRNLKALEDRRRLEIDRERAGLEAELSGFAAFESSSALDADLCVGLAAELRRVAAEDTRVRDEVYALRESLASRGHEPERLQWLTNRLGRLLESDQQLLRKQSELALAHQTEVAGLEQERTASSETLREIDAQRTRWRLPGWFLVALGLAGIVAGIAVLALEGLPALSTGFFGSGVALLAAGAIVLATGNQARAPERVEALRKLAEAQRRLNELRSQRADTEVKLEAVALEMGYRDQVELLREWNEFMRLADESSPALRAQGQLAALETRRRDALEQARILVERFGGSPAEPANLEQIATAIRRLALLRQRMAELEKNWAWIDEEKRVAEAAAAGLKERAQRLLEAAGIAYDPDHSWAEHARELAERTKGRARHATLTEELIPRATRRLMDPEEAAELRHQLTLIEAAGPDAGATPGRTPIEVEAESRRCRETLDEIQKRHSDLRVQVEEIWRRHHIEHPERMGQLERIEQALARARRFKHAVELARDTIHTVAHETHRRWADYLNQHVGQLLVSLGTRVEQLRFGDDLDFSVKLPEGQPVARGKADQQLSSGARDQLYLAVRLAISELLSRGRNRLPLLLDDVFATSDDERAQGGMRLLIEHFSRDHQIVLVTCHRKRYEALAQLEPQLYAERVRWLDTRSAGVAR